MTPGALEAAEPAALVEMLFVSTTFGMGGAERHAATLLVGAAEVGFCAHALAIEDLGIQGAALQESGIPVEDLALGTNWIWGLPMAVHRLRKRFRDLAPDVIMLNGFSAEVLGRLASRRQGYTLVSWKHNCGHLGRIGARDRWLERLLGGCVTRYFGVSFGQLPYLLDDQQLPNAKVRVIHNAVAIPPELSSDHRATLRAELDINAGDLVVMCVAVLRAEKDHASLLRAFALLAPAVPAAKLVLVGDGPERHRLGELADRLNIGARVVFAGHRTDAVTVVALADVVALTSYTVENLPFAILEAMAAGKPCVCTAVGGLPEMVADGITGYLVPPKSVTETAARLTALLMDPLLAARMGRAARKRISAEFLVTDCMTKVRDEVDLVLADSQRTHP